jgi:hypothetical protein
VKIGPDNLNRNLWPPHNFFLQNLLILSRNLCFKPITEMKYKHTFEAAMANLDEIRDLLQEMNAGDSVSSIEIDLVLQKTRNFYEVLLMLKQPSGDTAAAGKSGIDAYETQTTADKKPAAKEPVKPDERYPESRQTEPAEGKPSPATDKKKRTGSLPDSQGSKKVLGESIDQPIQYQEISSRLYSKPITNLATAIGINERFLYIRELFGNDTKKYEQAIEIMNSAASFNDAYNYMIRDFTWDMDSELVQGLLELVRRKFITGQHE